MEEKTNTIEVALYMIPVEISEGTITHVLPSSISDIVDVLDYFAVENIRSARRFIRRVAPHKDIDSISFFEIGKHSPYDQDYSPVLAPLLKGKSLGVLSEAGCPGIADPGAKIVSLAHRKNIRVVPLVGPSSILLALMASGLNGQHFTFNGYLPKDLNELKQKICQMESLIRKNDETQIFIETPFRNNKLLADLLRLCKPDTLLTIAQDLSGEQEYIVTRSVSYFRRQPLELPKLPTVFLLGR